MSAGAVLSAVVCEDTRGGVHSDTVHVLELEAGAPAVYLCTVHAVMGGWLA